MGRLSTHRAVGRQDRVARPAREREKLFPGPAHAEPMAGDVHAVQHVWVVVVAVAVVEETMVQRVSPGAARKETWA